MTRFIRRTGRILPVALLAACGLLAPASGTASPAADAGAKEGVPSERTTLLVPRRTRLIINYRRSVLA